MLAAKTMLPVIGVPIPTQHLGGLDSLLSIVQMPRGVPVATVAIGNAMNAGLLAAEILALSDAPSPSASRRGERARPRPCSMTRRIPRRLRRPESRTSTGVGRLRRRHSVRSTQGVTAPRIPTSIDHSVEVAVMNSRRPSAPPNVQLPTGSGQHDPAELGARPASRTWIPSPADVQTLPSTSTRKPSGTPGSMTAKTRGAAQRPAVDDVEGQDVVVAALDPRARRVGDVQDRLVGREGQAVRVDQIVADDRQLAGRAIQAEDEQPPSSDSAV